jgi:hypothetical protein
MAIKLSRKTIIHIILIIIFVLIIITASYKIKKNERIENLINVTAEDIIANNSYDFIDDKIRTYQEQQICIKDECNKVCNSVSLPQNFTFNTNERIRDYIEEFFILYLNVLDIGCINSKIKKYIGNDLTMGKIFKLKNLTINSFSPLTFILLDNIYYANNIQINQTKLNNFGMFKLVKNKFDTKLKDYKYYYDSKYYITLTKNRVRPEMEEKLIKNIYSEDSNKYINNILDCTDSICIININSLYNYDSEKRLSLHANINTQKIKDDLGLNMNRLIELCQISIVIDLFLKYNNVNNVKDLQNIINVNNITLYNSLKQDGKNIINSMKSNNYEISEFIKYISLNLDFF